MNDALSFDVRLSPLVSSAPDREPAADAVAELRVQTRLRRVELFFIWGFWAFIVILTVVNVMMNAVASGEARLPFMAPFVAAVIEAMIWGLLTPVLFRLTSRYSLELHRWVWSLVMLLVLGLVISLAVSKFMSLVRYEQARLFVPQVSTLPANPPGAGPMPLAFWFVNEFIIYLVIMAAGYAHDYFMRYHKRMEEASTLRAQAAHLRAELADARLNVLRAQLNPHFLFNTLNAIYSLVASDPRGAQRMIARLSGLLRDTLSTRELEVSLARELAFVQRYVDIMQTRFQGRLEVAEQIAPEVLNALVPNLILQPLIENAIKHGIDKLDGIGRIEICAARDGEYLQLSVSDNGVTNVDSAFPEAEERMGFGLKNTRERLMQSYGERQSLELLSNAQGGATARISLPFHLSVLTERE